MRRLYCASHGMPGPRIDIVARAFAVARCEK